MRLYIPKYLEMHDQTARLTIQFIRNYDRFQEEAEAMLTANLGLRTDGEKTTGSGTPDPTAKTAARREHLLAELKIIDDALKTIPEEYRAVIWSWVKDGIPLYQIEAAAYASERTWYEYKRRFITEVARRKGWTP